MTAAGPPPNGRQVSGQARNPAVGETVTKGETASLTAANRCVCMVPLPAWACGKSRLHLNLNQYYRFAGVVAMSLVDKLKVRRFLNI
jgi:hypothetical protein